MSDYISRELAIRAVFFDALASARIQCVPAADVVEKKHGKWERNIVQGLLLSYSCSECKEHLPYKYNTDFCPSCGAKMELCENRNKVERTMYPSSKDGD